MNKFARYMWLILFQSVWFCVEQVNLLFAEERKICDEIFYGVTFNKDLCFAEVTVNSVSMLLSFGDSVAKSKRSPEKIFPLLDMYEVLHELQPEVYNWNSYLQSPISMYWDLRAKDDVKILSFV